MLRADQNITDPGSKGRVLLHTSTNDYYAPDKYFLGCVSIIQSFGKMRRGSWSRQHEDLTSVLAMDERVRTWPFCNTEGFFLGVY